MMTIYKDAYRFMKPEPKATLKARGTVAGLMPKIRLVDTGLYPKSKAKQPVKAVQPMAKAAQCQASSSSSKLLKVGRGSPKATNVL